MSHQESERPYDGSIGYNSIFSTDIRKIYVQFTYNFSLHYKGVKRWKHKEDIYII